MNSAEPSSATILIVDDQEQNLLLVGTVLTMTGYEIISAQGGEQAFQRLDEQTPDLILLDLLMPEIDGIEVCRQLKADARWADLPVIFLSAADDKNLIVEALECGGVDYVTKPFNKAELVTRVRTHLALKQARDQLRELAEDKDELLGILTHDLGNHLAGIQMSAGVLLRQEGGVPPKSAILVENIAQSTECMLGFVKEFLANQSAERLQLNPEVVDIRSVIRETASIHGVMASAKNISLQLDLPEVPMTVLADAKALRQVTDNLVSNAVKFSPNHRTVTLSAGQAPLGWIEIQVRDEGPGFTEDDQKRMFRRYGRLSARPTGGEPSTGLGLSIVKRLVDAMNGRIMLESEAGKGAAFSVRLPAAPSE
jgi:two-component system sensor histidine kinase/response regulator